MEASFPAREKTRRAYDFAKELTRQMLDAGGVIMAGTDAPNPGTAHGSSRARTPCLPPTYLPGLGFGSRSAAKGPA